MLPHPFSNYKIPYVLHSVKFSLSPDGIERRMVMKKYFAAVLCMVLVLCLLSTPVRAASMNLISYASVNDLIEPRHGYPADMSAISAEPEKYTVRSIVWQEYGQDRVQTRTLTAGDTFVIGYYYFVFIELKAVGNYIFDNSSTLKVNGQSATFFDIYDGGERAEFFVQYDPCKKNIDKVELTIITPVVGKTPTFAKAEGEGYVSQNIGGITNQANGVTWTNQSTGVNLTVNNLFKADTKYTVTYHLVAKENYQFNGTKYYINGQRVDFKSSNMGQTEVVLEWKDIVPDDGKTELKELDLSVPVPKEGEKPDYTKLSGTGYYSDNGLNGSSTRIYKNGIAWYKSSSSYFSPGTAETFEGGKEYTVKLSLLPADGYKFATDITVKINGKAAAVEHFDDGSITVSLALTAARKEHVHTPGNWQFDTTHHWQVCSDPACSEVLGNRQSHNDGDGNRYCDMCGFEIPTSQSDPTEPVTQPSESTGPSQPAESTEPSQPAESTEPTQPAESTEPTQPVESTEPSHPTTPEATEAPSQPAGSGTQGAGSYGGSQNDTVLVWVGVGTATVAVGATTTVYILKKKKN